MTSNQHTELLAAAREVDVEAIERELTALWKDASPAEGRTLPSGGSPEYIPVVRACALNLIVVTEDEEELEPLAEMVGDVTLEHPARIFLILANRHAGTPKLDAWISARCSLPVPGGKQICCEQINLTAGGPESEKIPSIVTSLLVSDIPSILLWKTAVDAGDQTLQSLARVVDRILIDSSEDLAPESGLLAWRDFMDTHGHCTFGDLAWTHLTSWRSMIANAFTPPDLRPRLAQIEALTVEYSSTRSPRHSGLSQALLLVSWFTEKLRWSIIDPLTGNNSGEYTGRLRHGDTIITVRILPIAAKSGEPGGIESVRVQATPGLAVSFSATEYPDCIRFHKQENTSSTEQMLTHLSNKSEAVLVAQELEVVTRDAGYEAALKTLAGLIRSQRNI